MGSREAWNPVECPGALNSIPSYSSAVNREKTKINKTQRGDKCINDCSTESNGAFESRKSMTNISLHENKECRLTKTLTAMATSVCVCVCVSMRVFLYLLHVKYQNTHSVIGQRRFYWEMKTFWSSQLFLFEGKQVLRFGLKLGERKGLGSVG